MHPIFIKIGPITIHTYGFLLAIGVLSAFIFNFRQAKKQNIDLKAFSDLIFYTILIGLLGSKLFLVVTEIKVYLKDIGQLKHMIRSAGTFYGGLIFGSIFAIWYIKRCKLKLGIIADIVGPSIALAHFFGRMGCFFAGCCWGRKCHNFLSVTFTSSDIRTGVPLHTPLYPTQLIEAILNLINFIFLFVLLKKKKFNGQVFIIYIFNYSIIRYFVEYFRGDPDRGYIFGGFSRPFSSLSVPQLISLIGIVISIILYKKIGSKTKTIDS